MAEDRDLIRTLATLAEQLAHMQLRTAQPGFASVTAMPDLSASIPAFPGAASAAGAMRESARDWVSHVNAVAAQAGWSDGITLAVASSKVSGTALKWHRATGKRLESWSKWAEELQKVFPDDDNNPLALYERMLRRTQGPRESVADYFFDKSFLCSKCDVKEMSSQWRNLVIAGLRNANHAAILRLQAATFATSLDLLEAAKNLESGDAAFQSSHGVSRAPNQDGARSVSASAAVETKPKEIDSTKVVVKTEGPRCYKCRKYGHIVKDCPTTTSERAPESVKTNHSAQYVASPPTNVQAEVKYVKTASINKKAYDALVDTGSSVCTIRASDAMGCCSNFEVDDLELYGFGHNPVKCLSKFRAMIEIDGVKGEGVELHVVPDTAQHIPVIIGRTWTELPNIAYLKVDDTFQIMDKAGEMFNDLKPFVQGRRMKMSVKEDVALEPHSINFIVASVDLERDVDVILERKDSITGSLLHVTNTEVTVPVANSTNTVQVLKKGSSLGRVEEVDTTECDPLNEVDTHGPGLRNFTPIDESDVAIGDSVTAHERQALIKVLNEHRDCFAMGLDELGCTNLVEMDIVLEEGSSPVYSKPYRTSKQERETIQKIVDEWKAAGIVTDSRAPYASPVLLVRKKNGEPRLVVDFRKLNAQTVKDKYPLPHLDDAVEQLAGSKLFTTLDLAHGFLQIPLKESAKEKTTFVTPDGTWKFERLIFGLANGPTEFQRLMNTVLGSLRNTIAVCYLDDILVPARTFEEMLERLTKVFEALRNARLTLRLSKCSFADHEVEYLGFVISEGGVRPGTAKVKAISDFPAPKDLHDVKRFLGLTSFFRRFVPRYAALSEPLTRLTRKGEPFKWDSDQEQAFQDLKCALTSDPVLQLYNPKARTEVHTDACANGLAGILLQADENDVLHPVYYVSKKTSPAERFYHSSRLELLAIVWTIERLRPFLIGIEFTLVTDCQALVYLNANKTLKAQIARWFDMLQEYTFEIRHRPGSKMEHVDAMSRAAVEDPNDPWDKVIGDKLDVCLTMSLEDQALVIQRSDKDLRRIVEILEKTPDELTGEEHALVKDLVLKEGRLFREVEVNGKSRLLYVMPKSMRKSLCVKFHDLEGHFGLDRTVAKIGETYWFPGMRRYVREHIRRCFECLICKVPSGKGRGLLHPIPPGNRPFETVHADHLGPFVRSKKGNKELLVIVDNLTKYVKLYPSRDTTTKSVIKSMEDFILSFGLPTRIVTDRGTCFTSKAFEDFCTSRGIQHVLNSTRHPRANGQVERVNRTLIPTIMTSMDEADQRTWDVELKNVESYLNTSYNKSTGRTPFELLHGYNPKFHDGALRALVETGENVPYTDPQQLQVAVREKILGEQEKYKARFDLRHCAADTLRVGDIVVMRSVPEHTGEPTKTQPRYRGPLVVTKVLPRDTYQVSALKGTRSRHYVTTAHISSLKTWSTNTQEDPDDTTESEDVSIVSMAEC